MSELESRIAAKFTEIADGGWFPSALPAEHHQLRAVCDALTIQPGQRILDAGCARGRFLKALVPTQADLYGVDLTEIFLSDARRNVPTAQFCQGSLAQLPFAAGTFDAILCVEALEHLSDTGAAIRELARVLKPEGTLVIIDKNARGLHPGTLIPNAIWKRWHELKGDWTYSGDFPFRERWFHPDKLKDELRAHFRTAETRFLIEPEARYAPLVKLFPMRAFEAAWIARFPIINQSAISYCS